MLAQIVPVAETSSLSPCCKTRFVFLSKPLHLVTVNVLEVTSVADAGLVVAMVATVMAAAAANSVATLWPCRARWWLSIMVPFEVVVSWRRMRQSHSFAISTVLLTARRNIRQYAHSIVGEADQVAANPTSSETATHGFGGDL